MATAQEIITRGYKAILSTKDEIKLDPQEVDAVLAAATNGHLVRVRQGLINPSYLVAIVEDRSREMRYAPGPRDDSKRIGIAPLSDILASNREALPARLESGGIA